MNRSEKWMLWFVVFLLVGGMRSVATARSDKSLHASVHPEDLNIGVFYRGTKVVVQGDAPRGSDIIVRFVGVSSDLHLKKKGKVLGLLWMNLDSFTFKNVPNVFLVYSERDIKKCYSDNSLKNSGAWKLSLEALTNEIKVEPESGDREFLARELIKLKENQGLYAEVSGAVITGQANGGRKSFEVSIPVPSSLVQGDYQIEIYAIQNGHILASLTKPIRTKLVGFPAFLFALAFQHALLYGLLATVVAIAGGLLMGLIFGGGKGAH